MIWAFWENNGFIERVCGFLSSKLNKWDINSFPPNTVFFPPTVLQSNKNKSTIEAIKMAATVLSFLNLLLIQMIVNLILKTSIYKNYR